MRTAVEIARPGGAVGRVGVPHYEAIPAAEPAFFGNITVGGGPAPARAYIDELLPDILEGRIEPGRVFDRVVALDEVPDGYRAMNEREALKMVNPSTQRGASSQLRSCPSRWHALGLATWGAADGTSATAAATATTAAAQVTGTKIRIRIGRRTLTPRSLGARPHATSSSLLLLPPVRDFQDQEKTAPCRARLARGGTPSTHSPPATSHSGPPGPDVVVYYRRGTVPDPGLVLLARLDSNACAFSVGTVRVRFERVR